jgi:hypothetical protein
MLVYLYQLMNMEEMGPLKFPGNPCVHAPLLDLGQARYSITIESI